VRVAEVPGCGVAGWAAAAGAACFFGCAAAADDSAASTAADTASILTRQRLIPIIAAT
jgi:hypothetical protein